MPTKMDFGQLPLHRKLILVVAILLFLDLLLPWVSVSILGDTVSANAWNSGLGVLISLLLIALVAWEGLRLTGNTPGFNVNPDLVTAVLAGLIALLTLVLFFDSAAAAGVGAWLGLILLIALGYGAYLAFTAGGGREMIDQARTPQGAATSHPRARLLSTRGTHAGDRAPRPCSAGGG